MQNNKKTMENNGKTMQNNKKTIGKWWRLFISFHNEQNTGKKVRSDVEGELKG